MSLLATAPSTPSVTPVMLAVVLAAALLHAIWNSLAHVIPDRLVGFGLIGGTCAVIASVGAVFGGAMPAIGWYCVLTSALVHVLYLLLLLASYQLGEFSQMYPLARGTAPWLVAVASVVLLGRALPLSELLGVLAISAGLFALVLVGGRPNRKDLPALGCAGLTGVSIAGYTVIDGIGVTHAPLVPYVGWLFLLQGIPMPIIAALRRRSRLAGLVRRCAVPGVVGGIVSLAAYGAVLWAQTSGALAPIAALRETSIVFGALIGTLFLGERMGYRRAGAAAIVLVGVLLISLP